MAFPTAVNSQITDAVIPANTKIIAEAPAMAIGTIYQTIAHSTGLLFENAVAAQQQQNTLAQAAANQGVAELYSVDSAAAAADGDNAFAENLASLLAVLEAFKVPAAVTSTAAAQADTVPADTARPGTASAPPPQADPDPGAGSDELSKSLKDAVRFANDTVLGHAEGVNAALRQCTDSFIYALRQVHQAESDALRRMLADAALVAVMKALLQAPRRAKGSEEALHAIKRMG